MTIRRPFTTLAVGLIFAGAAPANAAMADDNSAAKKIAADAHKDCLRGRAAVVDDGKSDVAAVGAAIAPACRSQLEKLVEVATTGEPVEVQGRVMEMFIKLEVPIATGIVRETRQRSADSKK